MFHISSLPGTCNDNNHVASVDGITMMSLILVDINVVNNIRSIYMSLSLYLCRL